MPDPDPVLKSKPARAMNRWGLSTLSVLQISFLGIALIALNYLSAHFFSRLDLSREAAYTLSPASQRYLSSKEIKGRGKPIKWVMACRRTSPFYERIRVIAEEYARFSGGKITLEVLDPMRSPDRVQQVTAAYGISLVRDIIIMDARQDESPVIREDSGGMKVLNPNVKIVIADEMAIYTTEGTQRKISGFQGEDILTAKLVESIEGKPRKIAFLADKSRLDAETEKSPWKSLETTLRFQNIELTAINLAGLQEIPSDIEGVALVAPKYDLTEDELAVLDRYWSQPRAALLMLLKPGDTPPKLRAFLRNYGVTPQRDRVIGRDDKRITTSARGTFVGGIDYTKDLAGQTTVFEGASASLEVREGADDLMNRQVNPIGLIEAAAGFWGETKFGSGSEAFDEKEDHAAPLYLAACVTRGAASDDRFAAATARMIVIANTDFLDPDRQRAENMDFLASSVNWLVGRESLAGIGPRSLGTYKLPLLDAQVSFINRINLFFLPAGLILIGAFVWSSRRA